MPRCRRSRAPGRRLPAHEPAPAPRCRTCSRPRSARGADRDPARVRRRRLPAADRLRERLRPADGPGGVAARGDGRACRARRGSPGLVRQLLVESLVLAGVRPGPRRAARRLGDDGLLAILPAGVSMLRPPPRPPRARLHRGRDGVLRAALRMPAGTPVDDDESGRIAEGVAPRLGRRCKQAGAPYPRSRRSRAGGRAARRGRAGHSELRAPDTGLARVRPSRHPHLHAVAAGRDTTRRTARSPRSTPTSWTGWPMSPARCRAPR